MLPPVYNGVVLPKANLIKRIAGAGGGVVSLWQETGDRLQLLQSQSISEQPVNCLDWNRDKPGEPVPLRKYCSFSSLDDIFKIYTLLTLMEMALLTTMFRSCLKFILSLQCRFSR
jgi:hypothetical protein